VSCFCLFAHFPRGLNTLRWSFCHLLNPPWGVRAQIISTSTPTRRSLQAIYSAPANCYQPNRSLHPPCNGNLRSGNISCIRLINRATGCLSAALRKS